MVGRSPARFLAPLALLAAIVAVVLVVKSADTSRHAATSTTSTSAAPRSGGRGRSSRSAGRPRSHARRYVIRSGDTLTSIASRLGVTPDQIIELNPGLDAQALRVGQRIKIRP
jgi:LysM repeat protein